MPVRAILVSLLGLIAPRHDPPTLTPGQMTEDLDQLAGAIRTAWAYHDDHVTHGGLDVDALLARYKAELPSVQAAGGFAVLLTQLVAELRDGHADVVVPGFPRIGKRRWPVRVADCAEGIVVVAVAPGSPGDGAPRDPVGAAAPRPGDELLHVNGRPVAEAIAEAERRTFASTREGRRHWALLHLQRTDAESVRFRVRSADGEVRDLALPTLGPGQAGPPPSAEPANWSLSWPAEGVACLRISSFSVPDWDAWIKAGVFQRGRLLRETDALIDQRMAEVRKAGATALILDLRGNEGGTDALGMHLASHLLAEPFIYMRLSSKYFGRWTRPDGPATKPSADPFAGRVLALIDSGCFSTSDNFLRCLDDLHPDFTAVGRPTGGGTGAPREVVTLKHSRAVITLCTMRVYGPKSSLIEGRGTRPDIPVVWTRDDHLEGRDPDLAAALRHLGAGGP